MQHVAEATGRVKVIEDLFNYPDWTLHPTNAPALITCSDVMAAEHPELAVTYMKAMIKVGRWANEYKRAAAVILNRQTVYLDAEDTYQAMKHVDMVPSLCAKNMQAVDICKEFMLKHGYIKNDFDVTEWAAPEFLEQAAAEVLKEEWEKRSWTKLPKGGGLEAKSIRLG
jgi:ABC-type nitrate/sulfonate/bicarbonate transport system substrate-binding protein